MSNEFISGGGAADCPQRRRGRHSSGAAVHLCWRTRAAGKAGEGRVSR